MTRRTKYNRAERVELVLIALEPDTPKTPADIAADTGLTPTLVIDAIGLLKTVTDEISAGNSPLLSYLPGKGWVIADSWDDKRPHVDYLVKHLRTRLTSASREMDVAIALFGNEVPLSVAQSLDLAKGAMDIAEGTLAREIVESEVIAS